MKKNRIDMFAYTLESIQYDARKNDLKMSDYEVVYEIKKTKLYFAFNKNTDDKIILKWQKALDEIKSDGTYDEIVNMYR